jgi:hypothetical protein
MLSRVATIALLAAVAVRPAAGQGEIIIDAEDGAQAAYFALTTTPVGALPSWIAYQLGDASRRGIGVRAHFGSIDEEGEFSRRTLALGVDIALGGGTLGFTGGYHDLTCDENALEDIGLPGVSVDVDCGGGLVLGANWVAPLLTSPIGRGGGATFVLGVDASIGVGSGDIFTFRFDDGDDLNITTEISATSFSATAGVPVLLSARSGNVIFVPHLTPRVGFGRASLDVDGIGTGGDDEESESGFRAMLGGGLGILFDRSGFGFNLGFQKVFVDEGKTVIGLGVRQLFR